MTKIEFDRDKSEDSTYYPYLLETDKQIQIEKTYDNTYFVWVAIKSKNFSCKEEALEFAFNQK